MSKYTTQIRNVIENGFEVMPKDYDFYDKAHKAKFEELFIEHYYFNEIGFETLGLFKHTLKAHLNIIMPRYKMLYESRLQSYDPSLLVVYRETIDKESIVQSTGDSESTDQGSGTSTSFSAVIPQSGLNGQGLDNFMKDADKGDSSSKSTNSGKSKQTGSSEEHSDRNVYGSISKTHVNQLQEIRDFYINIDMEIIESCRDLFMLIY